MHDLLQEMGLEIVRRESPDEPGKRSRLCSLGDVDHVLSKNTGTEAVQGILLGSADSADTGLHLNAKSFSMMKKLRLLMIQNHVHLSDDLEYLSSELRILQWWGFPLQSLTSLCNLEKLQEIEMRHSQIEYLWKGKKPLYSLKSIDLSHSLNLLMTPNFSGSPYLECLVLEGCIQLYEIVPDPEKHCTFLSWASFINCFTLAKQGCNSVAFTSMIRHLQEVSQYHCEEARKTLFHFVIPGNEIPEWFDHQTVTPSVSIHLHPGRRSNKFLGFALCSVFAVHERCQLPPVYPCEYDITCIVKVDGEELYKKPVFSFDGMQGRGVSDHLWFHYENSPPSYRHHVERAEWQQIEFSFQVKGQGLVVKKCGVRLVYEQDVEEVNQSNANISDEALEFPRCDDGKAAVVSHAISKRGVPHSHGGGSSKRSGFVYMELINTFIDQYTSEVHVSHAISKRGLPHSDGGESSTGRGFVKYGSVCFDEERRLKRLKRH
ncbi:hypothetical protein M0R45_005275 [Rubus argutus]|uniref:C-JID domain-containing protein n=1 Tax=Rubus argutus TaxID=59490 RepID=A0AAW1YM64_RUBAR